MDTSENTVPSHVDTEIKKPVNVSDSAQLVPLGMRIAGEWSWRILALVAVLSLGGWALSQLSIVVIPLMISLLLCALFAPGVEFLTNVKLPRPLAVISTILGVSAILTALISLIGNQFARGFPELKDKAFQGFEEVRIWIADNPMKALNLSTKDLDKYMNQAVQQIKYYSGTIANTTLDVGSTIGHIVAGVVLVLFITIFFLLDGERIWAWCVGLLPYNARAVFDEAGKGGWETLVAYVRVQLFVAFIDGVGIALVAYLLKVPLAIPLGVLVFLGAFIPILGSLVSGMVAVLVALVANGPVVALLMLAGVIFVQQFESHILQPFVIGNSLSLHPLAVVLAVAGGSYLAGIFGALFGVPLIALVNTMSKIIASKYKDPANPATFVKAKSDTQETDLESVKMKRLLSVAVKRFTTFFAKEEKQK